MSAFLSDWSTDRLQSQRRLFAERWHRVAGDVLRSRGERAQDLAEQRAGDALAAQVEANRIAKGARDAAWVAVGVSFAALVVSVAAVLIAGR